MPFTVAQLTDPHIGAPWSEGAASALASAVAAVGRVLGGAPDAVVVSGDVAHTPAEEEYQEARALLNRLGAPVYVVPGNHDDRDGLRRHFDVPNTPGPRLNYAVDLGRVRLIALDTKRSGSDGGELDAPQLNWLDVVLGEDEATPTLLAMHHPPLITGMPAMDSIGLPADQIRALAEIISRHRQVHVVAGGHVHRAIVSALGGASVLAIPSTDVQLALDLEADDLRFVSEPPCFAVHLLAGDRLISHIQPVHTRAR